MKQIVKLGTNRYIHLDSYVDEYTVRVPSKLENFFVFLVVSSIACVVAGAMLGLDITTLFNNGSTRGIPVQHGAQVETKR